LTRPFEVSTTANPAINGSLVVVQNSRESGSDYDFEERDDGAGGENAAQADTSKGFPEWAIAICGVVGGLTVLIIGVLVYKQRRRRRSAPSKENVEGQGQIVEDSSLFRYLFFNGKSWSDVTGAATSGVVNLSFDGLGEQDNSTVR
jgi:hypothetical protein